MEVDHRTNQAKELFVEEAIGLVGGEGGGIRVRHGSSDRDSHAFTIQSADVIHLLPVYAAILHFHLCYHISRLEPPREVFHR